MTYILGDMLGSASDSHLWPVFCMAYEPRMFYIFCKSWGRDKEETATETSYGLQSLQYLLSGPLQKVCLWLGNRIMDSNNQQCPRIVKTHSKTMGPQGTKTLEILLL